MDAVRWSLRGWGERASERLCYGCSATRVLLPGLCYGGDREAGDELKESAMDQEAYDGTDENRWRQCDCQREADDHACGHRRIGFARSLGRIDLW